MKTKLLNRHQIEVHIRDDADQEYAYAEYGKPAERFGLLKEIDQWTIRQSIPLLAQELSNNSSARFSIRLSYHTLLEEGIVESIEDMLLQHHVPAEALLVEIREHEVVQNYSQIKPILEQLSNLGCTLAISGIGCGSLQFAYLKHLPIELIRIDPSIIENVDRDNYTRAMVRSIIDIGHVMYKTVGAEGVQSQEAEEMLKEFGADCIQGCVVGESRSVTPNKP
jgi:EAL domain-containing protein (putative c-di-GMP-specific phosphodiesterase class I)